MEVSESPLTAKQGQNKSGIKTRSQTNSEVAPEDVEAITTDELVALLEKDESQRDSNDLRILEEWSFLIPEATALIKRKIARQAARRRNMEYEEPFEHLKEKSRTLAKMILESNYTVVYTGAGISTSASIPDYRGPDGLWTQLKRIGRFSMTRNCDLTNAEPTLTHMALKELCRRRLVKHIVSQNCDGLHLRSGIPQRQLSDIHGNMYIEVCPTCEKQYFRQTDVTDLTSRHRHKTGRRCHSCKEPNNNLIDTIVLYGERSRTNWPMNWEQAGKAAKKADLIICLGSSLKTLVKYYCLWPRTLLRINSKAPETKLVVINLQGTPKDRIASLKINGKCDLIMQLVMQELNMNIPSYNRFDDPLRTISIPFKPEERAKLRRNLLFDTENLNNTQKPANLFVSELKSIDNGDGIKMRIKALDTDSATESSSELTTKDIEQVDTNNALVLSDGLIEHSAISPKQVEYALPGWLTKGLRPSRTSSYKRKRHGNKGRKHTHATLKQKQAIKTNLDDGLDVMEFEINDADQLLSQPIASKETGC